METNGTTRMDGNSRIEVRLRRAHDDCNRHALEDLVPVCVSDL
jgi:hypothetical protein